MRRVPRAPGPGAPRASVVVPPAARGSRHPLASPAPTLRRGLGTLPSRILAAVARLSSWPPSLPALCRKPRAVPIDRRCERVEIEGFPQERLDLCCLGFTFQVLDLPGDQDHRDLRESRVASLLTAELPSAHHW